MTQNLASKLNRRGKPAEAQAIYEEILPIQRQVLGPEHPDTLDTMNGLACSLADQGMYAEAQAIGALQKGLLTNADDKIGKAIERTDGCPVRGKPDLGGRGKDWITDCDAQAEVYELLDTAWWALR